MGIWGSGDGEEESLIPVGPQKDGDGAAGGGEGEDGAAGEGEDGAAGEGEDGAAGEGEDGAAGGGGEVFSFW